ncbi:MAG: PAS domain-containing sensor histidine kinase [Clostridia bacterium]|nr:PAS domain-containing sensor histidine kinase [Clostridia bacterium]
MPGIPLMKIQKLKRRSKVRYGILKRLRTILKELFQKKVPAFKIVFIYALVGGLWIVLSDKLLDISVKDKALYTQIAIFKGWIYVIGTALMLYSLISRHMAQIQRSKEELVKSEEKYRLVIENTTDGLWDWDIKSDQLVISKKWRMKIGYKRSKILGAGSFWKEVVHPDDYEQVSMHMKDYLSGKIDSYRIEFRAKGKDGKTIWFLGCGQAVWDEDGNPIRMLGTHTDITKRKITELTLQKTMDENKRLLNEAIEYDKLKTEFFTNLSHEFRTPLNVILGTIQLMDIYQKKGELLDKGNKISKYVHMMKQNCYRLVRLVNNLIDITRIDTGFLELQLRNHNIVSIVEQITLSVADFVENKGVSLEFDTDTEEKFIACDADKIERVILNLLSNAVKYTEKGGSIKVHLCDKGDTINISISDTGIGIPEDKKEVIFERFRQVNTSLTRECEGSGIGLCLVKSLVEMHKGKIRVNSSLGMGSEFIIELPAEKLPDEFDSSVSNVEKAYVERIRVEFSDIYPNT